MIGRQRGLQKGQDGGILLESMAVMDVQSAAVLMNFCPKIQDGRIAG